MGKRRLHTGLLVGLLVMGFLFTGLILEEGTAIAAPRLGGRVLPRSIISWSAAPRRKDRYNGLIVRTKKGQR